jgi:hypothetical protein
LPLLPLEFFRHYWQYGAGHFSEFRGVRAPASSCVAPFTPALDCGLDAVAQCAAPAAGDGAAGGLAAQPIFVFQPVEGGLYHLIRGQAVPLIAAHIAQREGVFQRSPLQLRRELRSGIGVPCGPDNAPLIIDIPAWNLRVEVKYADDVLAAISRRERLSSKMQFRDHTRIE